METFRKIIILFIPCIALANESVEETGKQVMGIVDSLIKIFKGIALSDGISLWIKAILMGLVVVGGLVGSIWWKIYKKKLREERARQAEIEDQQRDITNNQNENSQINNDAQDLRDRMRNGNNGNV